MDWLLFAFALEFGLVRGSETPPIDMSSYVQLETSAIAFGHLELIGKMRSYQIADEITRWQPFRMDYTVGVNVAFDGLIFGVEHLCYHPVFLPEWLDTSFEYRHGWQDRIFVRITIPHTRS
jgi:hypothetical protein